MQTGGGIPPKFAKVANEMGLLRTLLFNVEVQRKPENLVFSAMAHDSMQCGTDIKDVMTLSHGEGLHPKTPTNAAIGYEPDHKQHSETRTQYLGHGDKDHGHQVITEARAENRRRQIATLRLWFQGQLARRRAGRPGARRAQAAGSRLGRALLSAAPARRPLTGTAMAMKYSFDAGLPEKCSLEQVKERQLKLAGDLRAHGKRGTLW